MDKKTITLGIAVIAVAVALGIVLAGLWQSKAPAQLGGAGNGLVSLSGNSIMYSLSADTVTTLIATSTDRCSSRVITVDSIANGASGIMLTFGEHATSSIPSSTLGHWQAASTTKEYDGEIFGCGKVKAIAGNASKVTITEF